ncbi:NACHT domain-containing protein [Crocosphaera sp.]|uniref:NACHT domain-containing protein n=1 Tax=Crocosphaera sp. TaxID=2729996 RepID=UPI00260526FF|nr:NACHT domain-containing protein [Crocosphaera sp.]MDJ0582621.1 NACHT domain-containing protein [Crocosphaera sp.]
MKIGPLDLFKIAEQLNELISNIFFEGQAPTWLSHLINYILLIVLVLLGIWGILFVVSKIKKILIEEFLPLFYNKKQQKRREERQIFAKHIVREIDALNLDEEWRDERFTELEAEIEAEGKRKVWDLIPFVQLDQKGLRREKSLSKALKFSTERLILIEGEPGSGKSVALRHLAENLAERARYSNNVKSLIPLYINLKKLERDSQPIDRNLIENFVKQELNRINDSYIERFLDDEFKRGIQEGIWLFLFDSFDELPEILSSVESDEIIRNYAEAIDNFLGGFNQCRGIIASRKFRGPKHLRWPRFSILPLENRRLELIRNAKLDSSNTKLDSSIEKKLINEWRNSSPEIQEMTKNPMFLSILCENMRNGIPFPKNTHSVFEIYLQQRLNRDQERLKKRFNLEPTEIRAIAEQVAFCMTLDQNLGLSPTRDAIRQGMENAKFRVPGHFDKLLDALVYLKLARSEDATIEKDKKFTFSHRRFQEYFATCVVLKETDRVSPPELLKDGRWRETTVVIFQTQPSEKFTAILTEADNILTEMVGNVSELIDDPKGYVNDESQQKKNSSLQTFSWPDGVIHLLGLLQDGFRGRLEDLGDNIQDQAERLLLSATVKGTLQDRKWGLEVAGITSQPILVWLLRDAFASDSQWLKEVAYRQTARLGKRKTPDDIAAGIRTTLLHLFSTGRLYKEYFTTEAHLSRLDNSKQYLNSLRLLRWIRPIDLILHFFVLIFLLYICYTFPYKIQLTILGFIFLIVSYFSLQLSSLEISSNNVYNNKLAGGVFFSPRFIISPYVRFFLFPLLWSIFAILAANTGKFTEWWWWLFLLFFPLFYFFCNLRKFLKFCKSIVGNVWSYIILVFYTLLLYLIWWSTENTENILAKILIGICITFMIFFILLYLRFLYQFVTKWLRDWNQWRKWVKQNKYPNTIDIQELLRLINSYRTEDFSKQLITISRERELIIVNKNTEKILSELAMVIENSLFLQEQQRNRNIEVHERMRRKKQKQKLFKNSFKKPSNIVKVLISLFKGSKRSKRSPVGRMIETYSGSEVFTNWLKEYTRKDKYRLVKLGSEFLDELYILIEQIRVRQKTDENQNN